MSKKKESRTPTVAKEQWHLYSLQSLPPNKFATIAKQILINPKLLVGIRTGTEYVIR